MSRLWFRNANLLDGRSPGRPGTSVAIEGERIVRVVEDAAAASELAPDDRVVDLAGRTLLPGLVNCHFHSTFDEWANTRAPALGLESTPAAMTLAAAKNVRTALHAGVTSVVCSSGPHYIDAALRDAVRFGRIEGPRMLAGSHELCTSGDIVDMQNRYWHYNLGYQGTSRRVDGPEGFRIAVREEIGRGADIVKINASNGHGVAPALEQLSLSPEEMRAAAQAAHQRGKKVRAHAAAKISVLECARAGFDVIDHADRADDECIEAILEAGSFVGPSALFSQRFVDIINSVPEDQLHTLPLGSGLDLETPEDTRKRLAGTRDDFDYVCSRMIPSLHAAGVKVVVGDDFGTAILPHGEYAKELTFYVKKVGIPALDVLAWATRNGAQLMGMGEDLGTIEEGKLADLLVVDGDPEADIACLEDTTRLQAILQGGRWVRDTLDGSTEGPRSRA
jgi:imidazolonepropionase-like amidohydrolase